MSKSSQLDPITQWLNTAATKPQLPKETIFKIAKEIQSLPEDSPRRNRLINKLVEHNLRLVPTFVHRIMRGNGYRPWGHECTVDLLQAGALGLRRAAEKFDPTRGYQFSTYAHNWIRCFVNRQHSKEMSPIYLSEDSVRSAYKYANEGISGDQGGFSKRNAHFLTAQVFSAMNYTSLDRLVGEDIELIDSLSKDYSIQTSSAYFLSHDGMEMFDEETEELLLKNRVPYETIRYLRMKFIKNMGYRQISEAVGVRETLVRSRVDSAIKLLRKRYSPDKLAM